MYDKFDLKCVLVLYCVEDIEEFTMLKFVISVNDCFVSNEC